MPSYPIKDPFSFLCASGLLGQINRVVLHPLGFALAATPGAPTGETMTIRVIKDDGKGGFIFDEESNRDALAKYQAWMGAEGFNRLSARMANAGFVVQADQAPSDKWTVRHSGESPLDSITVAINQGHEAASSCITDGARKRFDDVPDPSPQTLPDIVHQLAEYILREASTMGDDTDHEPEHLRGGAWFLRKVAGELEKMASERAAKRGSLQWQWVVPLDLTDIPDEVLSLLGLQEKHAQSQAKDEKPKANPKV